MTDKSIKQVSCLTPRNHGAFLLCLKKIPQNGGISYFASVSDVSDASTGAGSAFVVDVS